MLFRVLIFLPVVLYYVFGYIYLLWLGTEVSSVYLPIVAAVLVSTLPFFSFKTVSRRSIRNYEFLVLICLELLVVVSLVQMDMDSFRITSEVVRVESIWERLLVVHLFLSWMAALVLTGYLTPRTKLMIGICIILIIQSLLIAFLEGRRTAAILPIAFIIGLSLGRGHWTVRNLVYAGISGLGLIGAFAVVTATRTGSDFVVQMLLSRIFWPAISLNDVLISLPAFDPDTLNQVWQRFLDNFGVVEYVSTTNSYGRYMGYISPANLVVGINYGVLAEAFLIAGLVGPVLAHMLLLLILRVSMYMAKGAPFDLSLMLPFLFLHGYQMEIPYTVIVLLKVGLLLGVLSVIIMIFPKKEASHER